jgi:hypothetical protein
MSGTRRTKETGGELRQEKWASSLSKGIKANLVALRCRALKSNQERELIYFLHEISLRSCYGAHYSCNLFPAWAWPSSRDEWGTSFQRLARELVEFYPARVRRNPAATKKQIEDILPKLCLDPTINLGSVSISGFEGIIDALIDYRARFENAFSHLVAATQVAKIVFESLSFAVTQRGIVLLEGSYRSGKSYASQAWSLAHLGQCRYVQLPSSGDDAAFFRAIARSVGVSCASSMKAAQIRDRIEDGLRGQQILLIVDECEYALPQKIRISALPHRLNWIMTSLVNQGIPVAMIGGQNFSRLLKNLETRCPIWGSEQFHGRIKLRKTLPDGLNEHDLTAMAHILLPGADEATIMLSVGYAIESKGRVATLENVAQRAAFFADQRGRGKITFDDVKAAMIEAGYDFGPEPPPAIPFDRSRIASGSPTAEPSRNRREPAAAG